jgi:hypothetical protein
MLVLCWVSQAAVGALQPVPWVVQSGDTRAYVVFRDGTPTLDYLGHAGDEHNWAAGGIPMPLASRGAAGGREVDLAWRRTKFPDRHGPGVLEFTFKNKAPELEMRWCWRGRPGPGPIEHWVTIKNCSKETVTLFQQDSLSLHGLVTGRVADLWWVRRGGGNASTQGGVFTEPLSPASDLNLVSNCDDGASPVPWLAVQLGMARGLYCGWEFSGLGRVHARAGADGDKVDIDIGNLPEFKTDIEPGETFEVPPAFVGCYVGDIDEGAYSLHRWILQYLRPSVPKDVPDPTLAYNLYLDAGGPNAQEADVLRSAAFCHDLGFETFMPDAMWFPACGDWRWDSARFPNGVKPIEEYVHGAGMRLALWCAWTNGGISEHPDALSVRGSVGHPDWFNSGFPPDWKPGPFYGGRICLACPEAKEWALKKTQWLVGHHKLDYLKHDCGPIVITCDKTTHRHHYAVDASYWATMGYYEIQEKLRRAFPRLILENCSGGGHIKDFGIIQRTHYTVTTDTLSNLPDRQSLYDSTFAFPPILLQAYTYEREYKVPGDDPGSFLWRSAMMGAWQIDPTHTRIWTDEERDSARRNARIYKDWIRPMLTDVKVHHILPRPDGVHWDGMFYWSPGLKRGTLYMFRPDAEEDATTVKLKGLDASKEYWVWCEDGSVSPGARTAADLMGPGLAVTLSQRYTCDLIYLQDAVLGKPAGLEVPGAFQLGDVETSSDAFDVSARAAWTPSANARSYRVLVSDTPDFSTPPTLEKMVMGPSVSLAKLPPERNLYWKVQAVSWGGKTWNDGAPATFTTPKLQPVPGVTFVSDMDWAHSTAGAGNTVRRDTNYYGKATAVAGRPYPKGIWTHSFNDATPADVVISIAEQNFVRFVADAGVEDSAGPGSIRFQVLVDSVVQAESPIMRPGAVHRFSVGVTGAGEVTLRVLNGGDGYSCDHAAWGFARFIKAGADDPATLQR